MIESSFHASVARSLDGGQSTVFYPSDSVSDSPAESPLGNITKFQAPLEAEKADADLQIAVNVVCRYKLQNIAAKLLPRERVSTCSRWFAYGVQAVLVKRNVEQSRAYYSRLRLCNSVWHCPVCDHRISVVRMAEITQGLAANDAYDAVHVTYTMRHNRGQQLPALLTAVKKAYQRTKEGKAYTTLKAHYGIVGTIRRIEVTWSPRNGWHVHIHELIIFPTAKFDRGAADFKGRMNSLQVKLRRAWRDALVKLGHSAAWSHGLKLNYRRDVVKSYVAKKQLVMEITLAGEKVSRGAEGITPHGMLVAIAAGEDHYIRLFVEYAETFKGSQQLVWSDGLKQLLGVKPVADSEISEETINEQTVETIELLAALPWDDWIVVCKANLRGELLIEAGRGGRAGLLAFLERVLGHPFKEPRTGIQMIKDAVELADQSAARVRAAEQVTHQENK